MELSIHDERFEDIILEALPAAYERVRLTSYDTKRRVSYWIIFGTCCTQYANTISRPSNSKPITRCGMAM